MRTAPLRRSFTFSMLLYVARVQEKQEKTSGWAGPLSFPNLHTTPSDTLPLVLFAD